MNSKQKIRARFVGIGILGIAFLLTSSLYSTSITKGEEYRAKAATQYSRPSTSLFSRGTIFFTDKDGVQTAGATIVRGYTIYMNPKLVVDGPVTYDALSHYMPIDKATFLSKVSRTNDPYELLANKVDGDTAQSIRTLGLPGIGIVPETWRSYPGNTLASHELGLIGENAASSTMSGKYGLEKYYESVLAREGTGSSLNVFAELFSGLDSVVTGSPRSGDVVTTIEPTVQSYLEKVLDSIEAAWHSDEMGGIIMDPATGEIYAMASHPTFDPNNLKNIKSAAVLSNPLVEHVYEMGSIMKPLTMAIALDSGSITPKEVYNDTGCMTLDQKKICNYDQKARGMIPMIEILRQSLNIGAATIALKTGGPEFSKYMYDFGIGMKSNIDLPNEATPLTKNLKKPRDIDIATASYGQGIAVSPVGMARALSILANDGYLVTPHIVKEISYLDGSHRVIEARKSAPVLQKSTIEEVRRMLVDVVDTSLAKGALKKDNYTIAAKTGTAAIADHVNGGYYADRYLHSFFGFFPAYNPKFIVFLYHVYPKGAQYASETLSKPFDQLSTFLLDYYNVPPDR